MAEIWTHGRWRVTPGSEREFVDGWSEFAEWSRGEFPTARAMLLRDRDEPPRFFSFGEWESADDVERWRGLPGFQERLAKLRESVEELEIVALDPVAPVGSWP